MSAVAGVLTRLLIADMVDEWGPRGVYMAGSMLGLELALVLTGPDQRIIPPAMFLRFA